ncbi:Replication protein A 70 kDa DNA-binding subunit A [Rhynchospora pubera]|uniref:Replication protein A 70 kDa DNA-binding subunit A n=1 Tax=Rhynchospora pubera TaxID=906938 RepID=A0AAV8C2Y2_9POAL|nr:Replication protein A 70 kDa DNA-binding subunit A [Rhynchospora pubera]
MTTPLPVTTTIDPPVPVLTLTPTIDTENVRIHGRPVRIWEAADARFGRVYNMAFLFIDHTGSKIQGLIPVPEYQRQSAVFREDSLCEISRFTLEGSTRDYQVVKHPYMLSLTRETVVTMLQPGLYDIPTTHFDFVSFREIGVSVTHLKAVIDVIGRIVGFSDVVLTTGSQSSRVRGMYLADNEGRTVELALWGNYADQFDVLELFEQSKQCPIIIAINNAQIKYWRGIYGLKTYSGTRFHADPSLNEIANYIALTPHDGMPITLHATAQTYNIHVVTPHRADPIKVTMAQLMGLYLDNYNENYYQCAGVIMNINNRFDWYYESCPDCRRKLGKNGGHLWCDHCSARRPNSIPWYKIRVQAVDQTGDAQFVLLGRLGEQAVGMPAQAVVALQQQDRKITPAPLIGIVGKKFMFTFAGKQRVPYQENRIYTVVDLAPVPPELLDLLPQPILHIEAAPLFASASSTPIAEGEPHTPPHQSIATASPASPQIGHSLAKQSSAHTPTEQYATLADARGKRPLLKEQDTPDQPAATIKRKLDFDEPPADTLQRYVSNLYSRT